MSKRFFCTVSIWILLQLIICTSYKTDQSKLQKQPAIYELESKDNIQLNPTNDSEVISQFSKIHSCKRNEDICSIMEDVSLFISRENREQKNHRSRNNQYSIHHNLENGYKQKINESAISELDYFFQYIDILQLVLMQQIYLHYILASNNKFLEKEQNAYPNTYCDRELCIRNTRSYLQCGYGFNNCLLLQMCRPKNKEWIMNLQSSTRPLIAKFDSNSEPENLTKYNCSADVPFLRAKHLLIYEEAPNNFLYENFETGFDRTLELQGSAENSGNNIEKRICETSSRENDVNENSKNSNKLILLVLNSHDLFIKSSDILSILAGERVDGCIPSVDIFSMHSNFEFLFKKTICFGMLQIMEQVWEYIEFFNIITNISFKNLNRCCILEYNICNGSTPQNNKYIPILNTVKCGRNCSHKIIDIKKNLGRINSSGNSANDYDRHVLFIGHTQKKENFHVQERSNENHRFKNRFLLSTNKFTNVRKQSEDSVKSGQNRKNEEKRHFRRRSNGASNRNRDSGRFSKNTESSRFVRVRKKPDTVASYLVNEDVESKMLPSNSMKRSSVVSFSSDDYRRDIEQRIARDSDEIKDPPRLERRITAGRIRTRSRSLKNRQSIKRALESYTETAAIDDDTQAAEIIRISRDCGNASQQIVRKSLDEPQASLDYRCKIPKSDLVIGKQDQADAADNTKKLLARVLIISSFVDGKAELPFSYAFQPSKNETANYSVDSVSFKLHQLVDMYKKSKNYKFDAMTGNERAKNVLFVETRNDNDEGKILEDELKQLKTMHIQKGRSLINNRKYDGEFMNSNVSGKVKQKQSVEIVFPRSKQGSSTSETNIIECHYTNNSRTNENSSKSMSATNEKASDSKKQTLPSGRRLIRNKKLSKHRRKKKKKSRVVRQKQLRTNHEERIGKAKALHRTPVEIYESPSSSVISENEKQSIPASTIKSPTDNILFVLDQLHSNYRNADIKRNISARRTREKAITESKVGSFSYGRVNNMHYQDSDTGSYETLMNQKHGNKQIKRKLLSLTSYQRNREVDVSYKESSNSDKEKKFYGNQSLGREESRLYYSQVSITPSESSEMMKIQSHGKFYYDESKVIIATQPDKTYKNRYLRRSLKSFQELDELSEKPFEKDASEDLYFTGNLVGYNPESEDGENKARQERKSNNKIKDENLAKLFADGQKYDIAVKGKIHVHLQDPDLSETSSKSVKKKRCSGRKTVKSRKKVPRVKSNGDKQLREKKSTTPTESRNPLEKITDFFKKKFGSNEDTSSRKKIHANAKLVRISTGEENTIPSSLPTTTITKEFSTSLNHGCKCYTETTTSSIEDMFTSVIVDTESTFTESQKPETTVSPSCQYERTTEISSTIASTAQHLNEDENNNLSTKPESPHEIELQAFPETTTKPNLISVTSEKTTDPTNHNCNSDDRAEKINEMANMLEVLNFIKKLEKLIENGKEPFRIGDENGGVEIKLEKIYIRPGTNQSIQEQKDGLSPYEETEDLSVKASTPNAIHHLDRNVPSPSSTLNEDEQVSNEHFQGTDENSKKNVVIKKHKEPDNEFRQAYLVSPFRNSVFKHTTRTEEKRIGESDQSSYLRNGDALSIGRAKGRKDSLRKKKKRRQANAEKLYRQRVRRQRQQNRRKRRGT